MANERIQRAEDNNSEFEQSDIESYLPEYLHDFISDYSDFVKFSPIQSRKELTIPSGIKVRVRRLKSEARTSGDKTIAFEADRLAEKHRLRKHGVTARQMVARDRLDYQISQLADTDSGRKEQVLSGMRIAWYAFAAGIMDQSDRNQIINEIADINPMEMKDIEDRGLWKQIYDEEIRQVIPIIS